MPTKLNIDFIKIEDGEAVEDLNFMLKFIIGLYIIIDEIIIRR